MAKPIALLCSDTHIDEYAWADLKDLRGDSQYAFSQIVEQAIEENLPIIAAGDLLDEKRNDALPIGFMRRQFDRLEEANVPFWFIQGQHELQAQPWLSEIHRWPVWLGEPDPNRLRYLAGLTVYGIDWTPRDQLAAKLAEVPSDTDLLVMHQVCHGFMGDIASPELDFGLIPHVRTLLVGDFHQHCTRKFKGAQGQPLTVLSPGATHLRKIDEPPTHAYFRLYDDLTFEDVPLRSRTFLEAHLRLDEDLEEFVAEIGGQIQAEIAEAITLPTELQKPILRVHYDVGLPLAYPRILKAVDHQAFLFTKEIRREDVAEDGDQQPVIADYDEIVELGLVGCLPQLVDAEQEPEVFSICQQLLESTDAPATLEALRELYLQPDEVPDGEETT